MPASPQQTAESRANWREGWDKIDWTGTRPKQQGAVYRVAARPLGTVIDASMSETRGNELIAPQSKDQFRTEYLCELAVVYPEEKRLRELADLYHKRAESYDRSVCTGSHNGTAMPVTSEEMRLIDQNARALRDIIYEREVQPLGFSQQEWCKAIRDAAPN